MGFTSGALGAASLIGQVGGGLTSGIGSYYGAATQKINMGGQAALAEAQARIHEINARMAEQGAQSVLLQGQQQVGALTLKAGQLKSSQRTALAANGVDLGEGSAAELQASTDVMKEIDTNTLAANAVRSAWGYRTEASNHLIEAGNARAQAHIARATAKGISPGMALAGSLLGSATNVAGSWYQMRKAGVVGSDKKASNHWSPVTHGNGAGWYPVSGRGY